MRLLLPVYAILIGESILGRIMQIFESDSIVYITITVFSAIVYFISISAVFMLTTVFCVVRFYKNMFTGEGYLTMTLPVTAEQHIFSKLLISVAGFVASVIVVLVALSITALGEVLVEVFKAAGYLFDKMYQQIGFHSVVFIIEFIIVLLVIVAYQMLLFYGCISVGQLARKNRVLAAFGTYFALYVIEQILSTIMVIFVSLQLTWLTVLMEKLNLYAINHPYVVVHGAIWIGIGIYVIIGAVFFFVSRYIIKNRLNLE
jgi:hypothetical protein